MEAWDMACRLQAKQSEFKKRTDGVRCPDCGTDTVLLEEVNEDTRKMICAAYSHVFWFVRTLTKCIQCQCEWTDSSKRQKQLRSADEGAHVTVCCMHGCKVIRA
jgi:hypothetical protein